MWAWPPPPRLNGTAVAYPRGVQGSSPHPGVYRMTPDPVTRNTVLRHRTPPGGAWLCDLVVQAKPTRSLCSFPLTLNRAFNPVWDCRITAYGGVLLPQSCISFIVS